MPSPEVVPPQGESAADDNIASLNRRLASLSERREFQDDHLAREETGLVVDQVNDDLDANSQAVFSEVHKYLPELSEPVRLHDGDLVSGLEYNNGRLAFHGDRFGVLDGKRVDIPLAGHERRSGTVITTDGRVLPFTVEGNHDDELEDDFPLYPSEQQPPLPPLYARGGVPPESRR